MTYATLDTAVGMLRLAGPYLAFRALSRVVALETLVHWAWRSPNLSRRPTSPIILLASTLRLARLLGQRGDCLARSLVLYRELSRSGANPQLLVGFERVGRSLAGHAWVVVDGHVLEPAVDVTAALTPVCRFGRGGRLVPELS